MRTSNPALNEKAFQGLPAAAAESMTVMGTVHKTFILAGLLLAAAVWSWERTMAGLAAGAAPFGGILLGALVISLIIALVIIFKKTTAPYLAPIYAVAEGVLLGAISATYEVRYAGIVLQAVMATAGVLFALLAAYRSGWIRATENFKLGVVAATGGIALVYLIDMVLRMFGKNVPFIHESGTLGIGISVFIVAVAALNLVLDFDFIERGAQLRAPKYMEWYGAFGLMVTLIWLYLEILRLLAKSRRR